MIEFLKLIFFGTPCTFYLFLYQDLLEQKCSETLLKSLCRATML